MNFYRIGELACLAGVSTRTVDYYTNLGLIKEANRTTGKHRLYAEDALNTVKMVKKLQEHHLSLDEICSFFQTNQDITQLSLSIKELLDSLEGKIAELYAIKNSAKDSFVDSISLKILAVQGTQIIQMLLPLVSENTIL